MRDAAGKARKVRKNISPAIAASALEKPDRSWVGARGASAAV